MAALRADDVLTNSLREALKRMSGSSLSGLLSTDSAGKTVNLEKRVRQSTPSVKETKAWRARANALRVRHKKSVEISCDDAQACGERQLPVFQATNSPPSQHDPVQEPLLTPFLFVPACPRISK
jgi:hypothetical protein